MIIYDKLLLLSKFNFSEVCGGNTSEAFQSLLETVSNQTLGTLGDSIIAGFCGDNVGIPQVFIAQFGDTSLQGFGECSLLLEPGLATEDEGTDMATTDDIIGVTTLLEATVLDGIMENEIFSSVLIQVSVYRKLNSHNIIAHKYTHNNNTVTMQIESRLYTSALVILNDSVNLSVTTAAAGNVNLTQASYLLSAIVNGFGNQTVAPGVSEVFNNFLTLKQHNNTLFMHTHTC